MFQAIFGGGKEQFEGAALFIHKSMIPKYAPEALCVRPDGTTNLDGRVLFSKLFFYSAETIDGWFKSGRVHQLTINDESLRVEPPWAILQIIKLLIAQRISEKQIQSYDMYCDASPLRLEKPTYLILWGNPLRLSAYTPAVSEMRFYDQRDQRHVAFDYSNQTYTGVVR